MPDDRRPVRRAGGAAGANVESLAFAAAWNHHQKRNPHHWQYWLLTWDRGETTALPMPETYVREMIADWMGAGRAITGKWEYREWYSANQGKMILAPETRALVERMLWPPEPRSGA